MAALGEAYNTVLTLGDLRNQLIAKGFAEYKPVGYGNIGAWMHPLKARAIVLLGNDSDLALVYQKRIVDSAIRRA